MLCSRWWWLLQEGQNYLAAMAAAANYAWVNRASMTFLTRKAFAKQFGKTAEELGMHVVYDVSHNIAKVLLVDVDFRRAHSVHRGGGGSARCSGLSISRFNLEPVAMSLFSTVRSSEADQDQTPNTMFFTATTSSNRCPVFSPLSFRLRPFYSPVLGGTTHSGRQGKNFAGPSKGRHSRFPPPPPPDSRGLPVHGTAGHRGGYHGHLQLRFDRDAKGNG